MGLGGRGTSLGERKQDREEELEDSSWKRSSLDIQIDLALV